MKEVLTEKEEKAKKKSCIKKCRMRLAPYIINPDNHYKMTWDILIACSYFTCFWLDPFIFGFWYEPLLNVETTRLTYLLTLILLADSFLTPFTG